MHFRCDKINDIRDFIFRERERRLMAISDRLFITIDRVTGLLPTSLLDFLDARYANLVRQAVRDVTTSQTIALSDRGKLIVLNSSSPLTVTIPPNSSVAFTAGDFVDVVFIGSGQGSVIDSTPSPNSPQLLSAFQAVRLQCISTDSWITRSS